VSDSVRRTAGSIRTEVVWRLLRTALDDHVSHALEGGRETLDVLDAGGGTGIFAVPIAELGHHVTVVDPSPDSLFALERRAKESGMLDRIRALQGDADGLLGLVPAGSVDVVVCHSVLEFVGDPSAALRAATEVLRPGGVLSLLAANRNAVVMAKALAGHIGEARAALLDPAGRWGPGDPMPRRFDLAELRALIAAAGLETTAEHGVRTFADLVPGDLADEPGARHALLDLEQTVAEHPAFRGVATQLHLLARRTR
jgi:SAM-dependent methyltransferase